MGSRGHAERLDGSRVPDLGKHYPKDEEKSTDEEKADTSENNRRPRGEQRERVVRSARHHRKSRSDLR